MSVYLEDEGEIRNAEEECERERERETRVSKSLRLVISVELNNNVKSLYVLP